MREVQGGDDFVLIGYVFSQQYSGSLEQFSEAFIRVFRGPSSVSASDHNAAFVLACGTVTGSAEELHLITPKTFKSLRRRVKK